MATKKAASTKKTTVKKPAVKATSNKTTVKTLRADDRPVTRTTERPVSRAAEVARTPRTRSALPNNIVNIVLVELFGTMMLTLAALFASKETGALYTGLTFAALTLVAAGVSGGHFNPALSFASWTMRRLRTMLLPFYIGAQLLGAMLAVILINVLTNNALRLNFDHMWFANFNWALFGVELVGAAVFMFALAAVRERTTLSASASALGSGLALVAGLVIASSLLATVQGAVDKTQVTVENDPATNKTVFKNVPQELRAVAPLLNPAVAVAATENTDSQLQNSGAQKDETRYSRFGMEVILSTLIGAALGGNLYRLVAGRRNL